METAREQRIKRILYRTWYRGCKETDKILGGFAKLHAEGMTDAELDQFEVILEEQDTDLYHWLTEQKPLPPEYKDNKVMRALMDFRAFENQG